VFSRAIFVWVDFANLSGFNTRRSVRGFPLMHLSGTYQGRSPLESGYTGRAAAGSLDWIQNGFFKVRGKILFWYVGGTAGSFAVKFQGVVQAQENLFFMEVFNGWIVLRFTG
jgi:hypothetical protein